MNAAKMGFDAGELNEAIKGLTLRAAVYAGLSREKTGDLLRGVAEALDCTSSAEAEVLYRNYMERGELPNG